MQEIVVWGCLPGPDYDYTEQDRGHTTHPLSPRTIAELQDPSLDFGPRRLRSLTPPYIMTSEELQELEKDQAEMGRRTRLGLPLRAEYVPKPGDSGTDFDSNDIRIYTRANAGAKAKYWGVIGDDETMEEFWAKHDQENTRLEEEAECHSALDEKALETSPPRDKSPARRPRSKQTKSISGNHRVKKPAASTSPVNGNTRRSLGSNKDTRHHGEANQAQADEARPSSRPARVRGAARAPEPQQRTVEREDGPTKKATTSNPVEKDKAAARTRQVAPKNPVPVRAEENTQAVKDTGPSKGRMGRATTKVKPTPRKESGKKEKVSVVHGNAKVMKKEKPTKPSAAPSVHGMRTRARGSAENTLATGHRSSK